MTSTYPDRPVLVVLGAGPGLGMSVAHRFGAQGYAVALVSRSADRHSAYLHSLEAAGVEAATFVADVADSAGLRATVDAIRTRFGRIDVGYYGPANLELTGGDITQLDKAGAESALQNVLPAVDFAALLLPELTARGTGGLLFAGGLSSVVPMPALGGLALAAAALRNYAVTLHAALAPVGIYAGTLTIGGLIDRGDIHTAITGDPGLFGGLAAGILHPDDLAETAWQLFIKRDRAEAVINAFGDFAP